MRALLAALILLSNACIALASTGGELVDRIRRTPADAWAVASPPFRREHLRATAIGAAAFAGLLALDEPVRRTVQASVGQDDRDRAHSYSRVMDPRRYFWIAGSAYAAGLAADAPALRRAGLTGVEGLLINSVFTGAIKKATGRARPFTDRGALWSAPFSENASFPSGHTSNAFVAATVIARSAHRRSVSVAAYALAGSVAAARVIEDVHWTSDVCFAALLGTGVGWAVTRQRADGHGLRLEPCANPPGLAIHWRFEG